MRWRRDDASVRVAARSWPLLGRSDDPPFVPFTRVAFATAAQADLFAARDPREPDPFEPLFRLYDLGYALDRVLRAGPVLVAAEPLP